METRAVARYVRVSPQKARLVVDLIRGKDVAEAQQILEYSPKAAAQVVSKVLMSALANAENNNGLSPEQLFVAKVFVDEGPTLKRWRPRAYGRPTRINKRTSHVTVILDEREPEKAAKRRRLSRMMPRRSKAKEKAVEAAEAEAMEEELEELEEESAEASVAEVDAPEAPAGDEATGADVEPEVAAAEPDLDDSEKGEAELQEAEHEEATKATEEPEADAKPEKSEE